MRLINGLAYRCSNMLMNQLKENHEKRRVYYYGFIIVFGAILKGLIIFSVSFLLGVLLPTLFIVLMFGSVRMIIGGSHLDKYWRCIFTSMSFFILISLASKYSLNYWNSASIAVFVAVTFIIALSGILKWAPSDSPNRPITNEIEKKRFRTLSILYSFLWVILISCVLILNITGRLSDSSKIYIIAACFTFLLAIFAISPAGYKFFRFVSGKKAKVKL
ncbi:MAG TPA: accessory gene regulator B family protein [Pseudobacteroides sp.]|uniref:accessory gene regulator ArgB-like protein n=1 Tax=Pseudobacteroides sp. TaxID=1968840 RepID=UPI002F95EEBE